MSEPEEKDIEIPRVLPETKTNTETTFDAEKTEGDYEEQVVETEKKDGDEESLVVDAEKRSTIETSLREAAIEEEYESFDEDLPIEDTEHFTEGYFQAPHIYGVRLVVDPLIIESIYNVIYELGIIPLDWPVITDPHFETRTCLPESYYKNNAKERILLMFAENFRKQYIHKYPKRRPLLLQAENDCGLQKMVCTTIRPTWIRFPEMRTWEGCAKFVADYLDYDPLHKTVLLPKRILSPYTVLKRQKGNSFEYATLLVSYLLGANINAYVVFGYATREFTLGIFNRRTCPEQLIPPKPEPPAIVPERKYTVKPGPDFRSQHLLRMEQKRRDRAYKALDEERMRKSKRTKELETPPPDDLYGWRVHAWVLVVPPRKQRGDEEIPPSAKSSKQETEEDVITDAQTQEEPESKETNAEHEGEREEKPVEDGDEGEKQIDEDAPKPVIEKDLESKPVEENLENVGETEENKEGEVVEGEPNVEEEAGGEEKEEGIDDTPFYIEPSTGFRYELDKEDYLKVEAIYNDVNYYVNLQEDRVPQSFNIRNKTAWLPFLPEIDNELAKKQFDMPCSWVEKLDLSNAEFSDRYPGLKKITRFKKVILENYAPYSTIDGLLKRYLVFDDYSYTKPVYTHEWYDRRPDNLSEVHYDYLRRVITEYFKKGREDYLKEHKYDMDKDESCVMCNRELYFYHEPRFDHLSKVTTTINTMVQDFINRDDKLYYRLIEFGDFFENQELHRNVVSITEEFNRNNEVHASEDVAIKFFNVAISEIHLQYHYEENFVTRSTCVFYKPNLMDTGGILTYTPEMTSGYVANPNSSEPRQLECYEMLVEYMRQEEQALQNARHAEKILGDVIYLRATERKLAAEAVLLFDIEKNEEAKKSILAKMEADRQRKERDLRGDYSPRSANMALRDYIDMMLTRQSDLQEHYDAIVNKLKEDRIWYLTNQYIIKPKEETEYVAKREFMNFELSTLEIRMDRQKVLSKERFEHLQAVAATKRSASQGSVDRRESQVDFLTKSPQTDSVDESHERSSLKNSI